jgi:hypothetical protein
MVLCKAKRRGAKSERSVKKRVFENTDFDEDILVTSVD